MNLLILAVISSMLVEPISSYQKNGETVKGAFMRITAYGLLPNGEPKVVELSTSNDKLLCTKVENCKWNGEEGLNRAALRYWVYFYTADVMDEESNIAHAKGDISKIDFHMSEQWDQKIFDTFDSQMKTEAKKLKDHIESLD